MHARLRGAREARFDILSYIDDDNWVAPDWVSVVRTIFDEYPHVGVCGGQVSPVHETPPPPWFDDFRDSFAIGPQAETSGDVSDGRQHVWGAGLCIRKAVVTGLLEKGFVPLLCGRKGRRQSAGEDSELCYAALLAGWRVRYDSRLQLRHFLPADRVTWDNLRRMYRGFGASHAILGMYTGVLASASRSGRPEPLRHHIGRVVRTLRKYPPYFLHGPKPEGVRQQLEYDFYVAYLRSLLRHSLTYNRAYRRVQELVPFVTPSPYRWGEPLRFDRSAAPYLREGWGRAEIPAGPDRAEPLQYVVTLGTSARVRIPLLAVPAAPTSAIEFQVTWVYLHPPVLPRQRLALRINGALVRRWTLDCPDFQVLRATFPTALLRRNAPVDVVLSLPDAQAPAVVEGTRDDRRLALAMLGTRLAEADGPDGAPAS